MTVRPAIIAVVSLLFGMGAAQEQPLTHDIPYEAALSDWSRVLARFVDKEGRIDFSGLAGDREDLDRFVNYVGRVHLDYYQNLPLFEMPMSLLEISNQI